MSSAPPKPNQFPPQHSSRWAMRIGFLLGRGYASNEVARLLEDGTHPATGRYDNDNAADNAVYRKAGGTPAIGPRRHRAAQEGPHTNIELRGT